MRTNAEAGSSARTAYDCALLGDFAQLDEVLPAAPEGSAWHLCLTAVRYLAMPSSTPRTDLQQLESLEPQLAQEEGFQLACAALGTRAILELDVDALSRLESIHSKSPTGVLFAERSRLWIRTLRGPDDVRDPVQKLLRSAMEREDASLVVEATTLSALAALAVSDRDEAVTAARRASRMARSEGIVQQEYLANVVLARVRRTTGRSHLAARILSALADVVPPTWWRWLDWELAFAGTARDAGADDVAIFGSLRHLFAAAEAGDRGALEATGAELSSVAGDFWARRADVVALLEALDPSAQVTEAARAFCDGESHEQLAPLEGAWGASTGGSPVYVTVGFDGRPRRLLRSGAGLLSQAGTAKLDAATRKDTRVLLLVTVLALRGDEGGLDEDVFREVYGFAYVRSKHEGVLRVLIHRARTLLSDLSSIERDEGRLRLIPAGPLLVADPRCVRTLEERVMHYLGEVAGPAGAKDVAEALGVSVRAAQRTLKQLAQDGVCQSDVQNRAARYRLEDTTFFEPTRSRVTP